MGVDAVETLTFSEDQIIETMIAVIEATAVPNAGPRLHYTADEMKEDGDARTAKEASFSIESSSAPSGGPRGSFGYTEFRGRFTVTAFRAVKGRRLNVSRRDMVRLQNAIRDQLTGHPDLVASGLTGWQVVNMPRPEKDGDDWYRLQVECEAIYYTPAIGRAA